MKLGFPFHETMLRDVECSGLIIKQYCYEKWLWIAVHFWVSHGLPNFLFLSLDGPTTLRIW